VKIVDFRDFISKKYLVFEFLQHPHKKNLPLLRSGVQIIFVQLKIMPTASSSFVYQNFSTVNIIYLMPMSFCEQCISPDSWIFSNSRKQRPL